VVCFYGSPALQHSLARSGSDLWTVELKPPAKKIGIRIGIAKLPAWQTLQELS